MFNSNAHKSWKYNRQFFTQAIYVTPSFNYQAIELWEQMEFYWNNLGENRELNLTKWVCRFTNDMILRVSTGVKNNSISSYYHTLTHQNNSLSEKEKEKIEET